MSSLLRGNAAALALAAACAPSPPRTIAPPASELAAPPAASLADRCPEQTARLARIDDAIAGRPEDPALHYFRATSVATCGAAAETAAALRRVAELGDGFLPTPDLGFRAVWDDPAVKAEIESMTAALSQVGVDAPMIAIEPDGTASDRRPLSFGRCAHRDPERHESRPRDHGTPRRVGNSGDRRDHALVAPPSLAAEPTTGAVDGARFLLLASTFVGRLRPDGTLKDETSVRPAEILALPLDPAR